jgi:cell division protein FtsQ
MPEFNEPKRRRAPATSNPPERSAQPKLKKPKQPKQPKPQKPVKAKVKTGKRRRKNMAIYYVMCFTVAITVFSILSVTVLFSLDEVTVEGESVYPAEQIVAASGIRTGVNLIRFNTGDSRRRIIDSLVYIDDVIIRKNLPNRVTIVVTGAREMASIAHEGVFYTISHNGRILERTHTARDVTVIYGFEADEPMVGGYIRSEQDRKTELIFTIFETAREVELFGITSIDITDFLDISLNYMDRITLSLGPGTQLEDKLRAAVEIVENRIESNERGTLLLIDPLKVVFSPE